MKLATIFLVLAGLAAADTVAYTYDPAGRLTSATYGSGVVITYTYDNAGNILSSTVTTPNQAAQKAPVKSPIKSKEKKKDEAKLN